MQVVIISANLQEAADKLQAWIDDHLDYSIPYMYQHLSGSQLVTCIFYVEIEERLRSSASAPARQ